MANQDTSALDAFLAQMGPVAVQPSATPTKKATPTSDVNSPENQGTRAQLAVVYTKAEEAAKTFKEDIAKYQAGTLSKAGLANIFKQYTDAQDALYKMDAPGSSAIQSQYFGAATQGTAQLRYDANGNSLVPGTPAYAAGFTKDANGNIGGVAPTIVFGADGKPVLDANGKPVTSLNAPGPGGSTKATSGTGGTSGKGGTGGASGGTLSADQIVPLPAGTTFAQGVQKSTFGVQGPQSLDTWASQYGGIGAMAMTLPWMKDLLAQAATNGWTSAKFTSEVRNYTDPTTGQKPWDQIAQGYRDSSLAYYDNKQAWAQQYNDKLKILKQSAIKQGEDPNVFGDYIPLAADGKTIDSKAIDAAYADQHSGMNTFFSTYYNNMPDQPVIDNYVSTHSTLAKTDQGIYAGQVAANIDTLKKYSNDMGISPMYLPPVSSQGGSGDWYANNAKLIQDGSKTIEQVQNELKQVAMATYKPFANRINEGMTVRSLASPYLNAAGNLLESSPDTIDLGSSSGLGYDITKALQGDGTNPTTLDSFMTQIKQRPEWLQTKNARDSIMDTATTFLRNMGMVTGG